MADLSTAQTEWIDRMVGQASELLPEKNRLTWRYFILKLKKAPGAGVQLSMRVRNAMGIERPIEANPTAQQAAKDLHAVFAAAGQTAWEVIEARFSQRMDEKDDAKSVVSCAVLVDPDKLQPKKS
jgi:hypothetical protein